MLEVTLLQSYTTFFHLAGMKSLVASRVGRRVFSTYYRMICISDVNWVGWLVGYFA